MYYLKKLYDYYIIKSIYTLSILQWRVGTKLFPFIFNIEISFFHELKETLGNQ
jgi:hypothetical protein